LYGIIEKFALAALLQKHSVTNTMIWLIAPYVNVAAWG